MSLHPEMVKQLVEFGTGRRSVADALCGGQPARLGVYDVDDESLCHQDLTTWCGVPGCRFVSTSLAEQSHHYERAHRYTCSVCRCVLLSPHFLNVHLEERHSKFFQACVERKPSFVCYLEECSEKFWNERERFAHGLKVHKLPKDFRIDRSGAKPQKKNLPEQMEVSASVDPDTDGIKEIENKIKNFSFGHRKVKTFTTGCGKSAKSKMNEGCRGDMDVSESTGSTPSSSD